MNKFDNCLSFPPKTFQYNNCIKMDILQCKDFVNFLLVILLSTGQVLYF